MDKSSFFSELQIENFFFCKSSKHYKFYFTQTRVHKSLSEPTSFSGLSFEITYEKFIKAKNFLLDEKHAKIAESSN